MNHQHHHIRMCTRKYLFFSDTQTHKKIVSKISKNFIAGTKFHTFRILTWEKIFARLFNGCLSSWASRFFSLFFANRSSRTSNYLLFIHKINFIVVIHLLTINSIHRSHGNQFFFINKICVTKRIIIYSVCWLTEKNIFE